MARVLYSGVNENGQPSEVMLGCAIGDIIPHFGTTAPPGTLVCDGSEVSREAYAELYKEIGSLVGQGDGSTTFNLPDLRGRWMMGADAERAAGEEVAEGLPNITAKVNFVQLSAYDGTPSHGVLYGGAGAFDTTTSPPSETSRLQVTNSKETVVENLEFDASRSNPMYGASTHVTPASVAVLPCIVYE